MWSIEDGCSEDDWDVKDEYRSISKVDRKRFNRTCERTEHFIFKDFDSNNLTGIASMRVGSQNHDGEAVKWAANRLSMRKEERKILIVFSDGQPAAASDTGILRGDLKRAVKKVLKSGIEVIGIGIQTNSVKDFYPDHLVVDDLESLPTKAMNKMVRIILKGKK